MMKNKFSKKTMLYICINLMDSIESHKENFSDCKERIDKSIVTVVTFITTYPIIDKATKIGNNMEE